MSLVMKVILAIVVAILVLALLWTGADGINQRATLPRDGVDHDDALCSGDIEGDESSRPGLEH